MNFGDWLEEVNGLSTRRKIVFCMTPTWVNYYRDGWAPEDALFDEYVRQEQIKLDLWKQKQKRMTSHISHGW